MSFYKYYNLLKSEFVKSTLTLMTGTILAQGISLLIFPILSRIYSPSEFGAITLYMSIVGAFAIIATTQYEKAIVIASDDLEAYSLLKISHFVGIGISVLNLAIVLIFVLIFGNHFNLTTIFKNWLYLMPVFTLMFGSSQAITHLFIRDKSFKAIAMSKIINSLGINVSMLLLGFLGMGIIGLYLANIIGVLLTSLYLIWVYYQKKYNTLKQNSSLISIAKKYIDFPKTNSLQALVEMFQMNGIVYLLGIFFNAACIGLFSFSMKVLMAPMWLIGTSISHVFFQKASEEYLRTHNLRVLFKKAVINSSLIATPILIAMLIFGPTIFALVFGEEWREAGSYARILAPWIFLDFVKAPVSQIPVITGRIKSMFFITLMGNVILILSMIYGGGILKNEKSSFIILSFTMCIYVILLLIWIYKVSIKKDGN